MPIHITKSSPIHLPMQWIMVYPPNLYKQVIYKAIRYEEIIADLVATVQSQNERISLLEQELMER